MVVMDFLEEVGEKVEEEVALVQTELTLQQIILVMVELDIPVLF